MRIGSNYSKGRRAFTRTYARTFGHADERSIRSITLTVS